MKHPCLLLGLAIFSAVACKQNRDIKVYRIAKDTSSAAQSSPSTDPGAKMPGMLPGGTIPSNPSSGDPHAGLSPDQFAGDAGGSPEVTDAPPAHWKKQAPTAMRQASYKVEGEGGAVVDISLVILRGAAGGTLDNVNRWRGQLGQPPIDEAVLKQTSKSFVTPVGEAVSIEIEGLAPGADAAKDGRMLGVIADKDGDGWFFKMRGNSALTASEKDNFMAWVLSVKPAAPAANSSPPAPAPSGAASAVAGDGSLAWQVPSGWVQAPAASSMRYATFSVTAADGTKGEVAITHFPGNVGGDLENVNRWRQQVSLPPVDQTGMAAIVSKISVGTNSFSLIDLTGAQSRLAAAWTRHGADTWFFKLTGPDALVGAEKATFTAFLESIRFNKPE